MKNQGKAANAKQSVKDTDIEATEVEQPDNVEKIRDILFGNQMREFDRKFSQLEDRIASDFATMRQENSQQIESLQSFLESEVDILSNKISSEEKIRIEQLDELDADLKKCVRQIDQKLAELNKSLEKSSRDTNQKMLKQSQDHSAELSKQIEQSRKRMDEYREELTVSKVDRNVLAEMLTGLAMQLNQNDPGNS